jgi:predicted AAA+ superfamily ATPase
MEQVILNQNKHWKAKYTDVFHRSVLNSLVDFLPMKEVLILTGIRRCGKSSVFKLLINKLLETTTPTKILFINSEDPHFMPAWHDAAKIYDIIQAAEKITESTFDYLFIGEVQNLKHWEQFIKSVYESGNYKKIFLTGSNSQLLENDYITLLSGRFIAKKIYPLSFLEILELNQITTNLDIAENKNKVLNLLDDYMQYGGFPEVFKTENEALKLEILSNYYRTIVLKDCIINQKIRESAKFEQLAYFVFNNSGAVFTYNSMARATENNENTSKIFLEALHSSFSVYAVNNFSFSVKANTKSKRKLYSIDNGLMQAVKHNFTADKGKMLENIVFSEIIKSSKFEVYFHNTDYECDFILKSKTEIVAIQVVYQLTPANKEREINGLLKIAKQFNISNLKIVTSNENSKIDTIEVLSFVAFCRFLKTT